MVVQTRDFLYDKYSKRYNGTIFGYYIKKKHFSIIYFTYVGIKHKWQTGLFSNLISYNAPNIINTTQTYYVHCNALIVGVLEGGTACTYVTATRTG